MTSRMLPIIRLNAQYDLDNLLPFVIRGNAKKELIDSICYNYRVKGICSFFMEGLPRVLHSNLQKSGAAFLHFLTLAKDAEKITSKAAPFFDAIACKDFDIARQIGVYSRQTWNHEEEYEDDFLYVFFLIKKFFLDAEDKEGISIIKDFEAVLEGAHSARLDICKAFVDHDEQAFDQALNSLIMEHEEYYRSGAERDEIIEEEWATEGQLFIEGLSLVRLAERIGFWTQENYLFIPSLARKDLSIVFEPNSWKNAHQ